MTNSTNELQQSPHALLVIEEFKKRPGITLSSAEVIEWTGLTLHQVQAAINRLRSRSTVMHDWLQPLISGHMWIYQPGPAHTPPEPPPPPQTALPPAPISPPIVDNKPVVAPSSDDNHVISLDRVEFISQDEPITNVVVERTPGPEPTLPMKNSSFADGTLPMFEQVGFYGEEALLRDEQGRHWRARPITNK